MASDAGIDVRGSLFRRLSGRLKTLLGSPPQKDLCVSDKDSASSDKDPAIADKDMVIADKDIVLPEKDPAVADKDTSVAEDTVCQAPKAPPVPPALSDIQP